MKDRAIKIRDEAIQNDFSTPNKRPRFDKPSIGDLDPPETEYLPFDFLPSAMTTNRSKSPEPKQKSAHSSKRKAKSKTKSNKQQQKSVEPAHDTYLDGVDEESFIRVLTDLRQLIERYNCKDRVLEALESFKRHDDTIDVFKNIALLLEYQRTRASNKRHN